MPLPGEVDGGLGYGPQPYYGMQPPMGHEMEHSFASGFGGLFGCGTSMITLIVALGISCLLNYYLLRMLFTVVKDSTTTLAALKEAITNGK